MSLRLCVSAFKKVLLAALFLVGALTAPAQTVQTILTNGPVSNRLNLVVLSEGYTSGQLAQFLVDATNAVNVLLSHPPFQEYRSYFNAYAIQVASAESGSDHPSYGIYRNTYFNSTFDDWDRLITIPADSTGQGKVEALLQTYLPQCGLPLLLVNDLTPDSGSDGFSQTAIASVAGLSHEVSIGQPGLVSHEAAHVLANLGDEYDYMPYADFPDTEEPNTTQETNRALIKWKNWISPGTPVPTPDSYGEGVVGLFQGAHYHTTNWYRPELNCVMKSLGVPFCAVCKEALLLAIYQKARPVDGFSPAITNLTVTNSQSLAFNLSLLQPATHSLSVQWWTNNVAIAGATNSALTLLPASLGNGNHTVKAIVHDDTALVRNDPTNLLGQTVSWSVTIDITQLQLGSPVWLTGGRFAFRVFGTASQPVVVQSSTNLSDWVRVATNTLAGGQFWQTNSAAGTSSRRFYRAATPP